LLLLTLLTFALVVKTLKAVVGYLQGGEGEVGSVQSEEGDVEIVEIDVARFFVHLSPLIVGHALSRAYRVLVTSYHEEIEDYP